MTVGSPNQPNADSTSPSSKGRRMSRLVSNVACTDRLLLGEGQMLLAIELRFNEQPMKSKTSKRRKTTKIALDNSVCPRRLVSGLVSPKRGLVAETRPNICGN